MKCPLCNNETFIVYQNNNMPYGINLKEKTINLEVSCCKECGFVFQSSSYTQDYDETIQELYSSYKISNVYNFPNRNYNNLRALTFVEEVIENSIEYNILEIGSNRGDFLYLLKEKLSYVNVLGCEPTEFKELKIPTINSFFNKELFNTKFDLIIIRHTLEHIKNPHLFVKELEYISKSNTKFFIEVPNIFYSLNNFIEDFTPDHVNHFSKDTLIKLFSNYKAIKVDDSEYLYMIFEKTNESSDYIKNCYNIEELFLQYNRQFDLIKKDLISYKRIVFYGIGNFYLWTYIKFREIIEDKELYFIDDNINEDYLFKLRKLEKFNENDLVILCSSNINTQNKMKSKIPKNCKILSPWKGIENV